MRPRANFLREAFEYGALLMTSVVLGGSVFALIQLKHGADEHGNPLHKKKFDFEKPVKVDQAVEYVKNGTAMSELFASKSNDTKANDSSSSNH